ncbi:hypothetical protein [Alkalimarinus sediminis]|uniref:Uncharacterized protein n=1 Tax=Alkalimarinus sediminis TaxID=1632866 RepID=A0A9E8HLJ1_9ALTE|nr:hypothetical protein [Alkalimarinus sediminis]UZW76337.1 hypothetical protein NNL22_07060 [Alkalimarinus sediminis]
MKIEIKGVIFKCKEDERVFFSRIHALPGFKCVAEEGGCLHLVIEVGADPSLEEKIQEICDIWNTVYRVFD